MTGRRRFAVGQAVMDHRRQARSEIVGLYPSPLMVRLADKDSGFEWIARTVDCEQLGAEPATHNDRTSAPTCAGRVPVDVPPTELRVGDHILTGGHLVAITDLRYRYGATRTTILSTGRLAVSERVVRVHRRPAR
ncbi:hypothetical protein PL81_31730 [Streptomyces sp. RSD-27]|nr:hypothetical protein PL81_31730 [Streptomyces sp. RSD-27]